MAQLLPDGTRRISLTKQQFDRINTVLSKFTQKTKCTGVLLSYTSGMRIAQCGSMDDNASALLSTLAAGNYSATGEMARLIGESSGFQVQFHEGTDKNIYVAGITDDFFLVVVFAKNVTFGMIRVQTAKSAEELQSILNEIAEQTFESGTEQQQEEGFGDEEFRNELSSRLDAVLSAK